MKKIYLAAMAVVALTVSSCSQDEVLNQSPLAGPQAIGFSGAYLGNSAEARGSVTDIDVIKTGAYKNLGMGVFAYYSSTDFVSETSTWNSEFMNNQQVKWTELDGEGAGSTYDWTYTPLKYWPETGKTSFVAYAPYTSESTAAATAIPLTVSSTIGSQTDLVVSAVVPNQEKQDNAVAFTMSHVLSKIGLKVTGNNIPAGTTVKLTDVTVGSTTAKQGFYTSGTYNAVAATPSWSASGEQALTWTASTDMTGTEVNATAITNNDDKFLFVIPQDFSTDKLPINGKYSLTLSEGATIDYTFSGTISQEFVAGNAYVINLLIDLKDLLKPIKFTVTTVNGWTPATGGTDVPPAIQ